ncbi:MAG: S8 family serine peptidase [Candidatus Kapabacteria bacterium]|nr:S8 family serine peptidase [Candidatus Kapabacteria bacterium]
MFKRPANLLVHLLLGLVVELSFPLSAQVQDSVATIRWNGRDLHIRAHRLVVRMQSARTVVDAMEVMPAGYQIESQLLDPEKTIYFSTSALASTVILNSINRNQLLVSSEDRLTRTFTVVIEGDVDPVRAARRLLTKHAEIIEVAEPWYLSGTQGIPNDPMMADQGYLNTVKAREAWTVYEGDASVVIGISDDGISQTHQDLGPNISLNVGEIPDNGIDDDANGYVDDYGGYNFASAIDNTPPGNTFNTANGGHGTKVTGIAAAATNNGVGVAGIGFRTRFFPMKTAARGGNGIIYGYQSLIYAAQRRFKVVNTSWGIVKPPSPVDQSVIDYCVANDLLVVASGGNHGNGFSGAGWQDLNFPSAYEGVLGTGETNESDEVEYTSGLGLNIDVLAPGNQAFTTDISGGYSNAGSGTSFASPMAAGLAGLVRGKYPTLTVMQTTSLIRRTADDITSKNPNYAQFIPGRMNMLRALQTAPMSIPAVRITRSQQTYAGGRPADRFFIGDTLHVTFDLVNDLGPVTDLVAKLSIAEENGWTVRFLNDKTIVGIMGTGEVKRTSEYVFIVDIISSDRPLIFVLDLTGNDYVDRSLWYLQRPAFMTTFENGQLAYSMGDDGTVGYNSILTTRQGGGFGWKKGYSLIAPSGFILCENKQRSLSAYSDKTIPKSDFTAIKPFSEPLANTNIMSDDNNDVGRIGVRVTQKCAFPGPDIAATIFSVRVQNVSGGDLSDVSSGYYLDWDIGAGGPNNGSRLAPEAIPGNLRGQNAVAQVFYRPSVNAVVCQAVYTATPSGVGQSAVELLSNRVDDPNGFTNEDRIAFLTSGTQIQPTTAGDLCSVVGMMFGGKLANEEIRSYIVVIGVGATEEEATRVVRETLTSSTGVEDVAEISSTRIVPIPASERITVTCGLAMQRLEVFDVTGTSVLTQNVDTATSVSFDVASLAIGTYILRVITESEVIVRTIVVMR